MSICINKIKQYKHFPIIGASFALIFLFALSFSYGSRPSRGRSLTKSPLLWAKLDGSLTDEVSSGSSFAYSPGKGDNTAGVSLKEGDNIQYGPGSVIDAGSSIYENWNPNQGTMSVWAQPNWAGDDNHAHWIWSADSGRVDEADANLQAYFKFDEGSENFAFDSSANSNVGYLHGPALSFDGWDFVIRADDADFDFADTDDFSIEIWFKHNTIATNPDYLLTKSEAGTNGGYKIYMDSDGDVAFAIDDDGVWTPDDVVGDDQSGNYDDNSWHHLAAIKNDTTGIYIYIDGSQIDLDETIATTATLVNDDPLYIGIDDDGSSNGWDGQIDSVRIYSRALSATEVAQHFVGNFADESGLVGYWDMGDGQGQVVTDKSGNGNNGTLGATSAISADDPTWVNYVPIWTEEGRFGKALKFDGGDDEVEMGDIDF